MKINSIFKNQWEVYEIVSGFKKTGKRKKILTQKFGEYLLDHTVLNLENMSASRALERIMDICGINEDDKFKIRSQINLFTKLTKENRPE